VLTRERPRGREELNYATRQDLPKWKQPPIAAANHVVGSKCHSLDPEHSSVEKADFRGFVGIPQDQDNNEDQSASDQKKDSLSHDSIEPLISDSWGFGNKRKRCVGAAGRRSEFFRIEMG